MHDLVLAGGHLLDPTSNIDGPADLAITDGRVAEVGRVTTGAQRTIDVSGQYVLPGVIDTHTHLSGHFGGAEGHRMVAQTGVVTALDLAGAFDDLAEALATGGAGLNVAFLHPMMPGRTLSSSDPAAEELAGAVERALAGGALGIKLLGGHYPLTPAATERAIAAATGRRCYVACHVGTTETGSDIRGLEEALGLAAGRRIHIAHVNSYCRGQETGDPIGEALRALDLLAAHPAAVSESYISVYNGTSARCAGGVPASEVTKTCLRMAGYPPTEQGLESAIRAGYARIHHIVEGAVVLAAPNAGLRVWRERQTDAAVSFPVNHIPSAILLATARRRGVSGSGSGLPGTAGRDAPASPPSASLPSGGPFAVDGLSTDGGAIPRNFLVRHGLMLVQMGAWTLRDFAVKASLNPARMLGIPTKGHLAVGADADVTVVDLEAGRATWSVAGGRVLLDAGTVVGRGGILMVTPQGEAAAKAVLQSYTVIHKEGWG